MTKGEYIFMGLASLPGLWGIWTLGWWVVEQVAK